MRLTLIDTCLWAPFFNRPQSPEKRRIDALLDDDQAALIGPILAEILQGIRGEPQADFVASHLRSVKYLQVEWHDWSHAARLGRRCAAAGHQLPLSDLVLAAVAIRHGAQVYTIDPHFDLISGVQRFQPRD